MSLFPVWLRIMAFMECNRDRDLFRILINKELDLSEGNQTTYMLVRWGWIKGVKKGRRVILTIKGKGNAAAFCCKKLLELVRR